MEKYEINSSNNGNSVNLKAIWKSGKVNYKKDAQKIIDFLEAEVPAGTVAKFKELYKCSICSKELFDYEERLLKLHKRILEKNHQDRHKDEFDDLIDDKKSVFWG